MEETIGGRYYRGKSLLPFEDFDEQFRDWVKWLQSFGAYFIGSMAIRAPARQSEPGKPPFDPGLQLEDEWRWRDIGGESGEAL